MCKLKSAIILKDRVYISDNTDSHDQLLKELGIEDTKENESKVFVRAEYSPRVNAFDPIDTWEYRVDQDTLPDWYVEDFDKERMIAAVRKWVDKHILVGCSNLELLSGQYYLKDCSAVLYNNSSAVLYNNSRAVLYNNSSAVLYNNSRAVLYDNSSAKLCDNSSAKLCDNSSAVLNDNSSAVLYDNSSAVLYGDSRAELWDNSSAVLYNNSRAVLYDNSSAELWGNSSAKLWGNSSAVLYGDSRAELYDNSSAVILAGSSVHADKITLKGNAILHDFNTATIYYAGNWAVKKV